MRIRTIALLAALASIPALAQAQYYRRPPPRYGARDYNRGPGPQGPVFGLRLGVGFPAGRISDEDDPHLSDLVDHQIPIWLEMGYRFTPFVWGTIQGEIAPTSVSNTYCGGANCDAMNYRIGADLQLHLGPDQPFDPWLGIGFGYEWLSAEAFAVDAGGALVPTDFTYSGWQLPLIEAGLDFALSPNVSLGPYVSWALGRYRNRDSTQEGLTVSEHIVDQAYHSWFQIGVKGTFKL
jgi:opacity protein-like surface antigen